MNAKVTSSLTGQNMKVHRIYLRYHQYSKSHISPMAETTQRIREVSRIHPPIKTYKTKPVQNSAAIK